MTSTAGFDFNFDIELERLHWSFEVAGRPIVLDLIPGILGSVAVEVDDRTVGRLPKPKARSPWRETAIEIDGERVDIALTWNRPVMHTDVFVGGRSLRDRRTIEQARAGAPKPASLYDVCIGAVYGYRRPARPPFVNRWMAVLAIVSLLAVAVVIIWMARPSGVLTAAVVGIAMLVFFVAWFASWNAVITRVHLALLDRPQLDDSRRVAWFTVALLGYPVLSVAAVVLLYGVARTLAAS